MSKTKGDHMHISRRFGLVVLAAMLGAFAFALTARGDGGKDRDSKANDAQVGSLRSTLAPSQPTDPAFHGLPPGGAAWSLEEGSARLRSTGKLKVEVEGLILTAAGNTGPITGIAASVFCGADSVTAPAGTTAIFPLSAQGDGEIEAHVSLPATCLAPLVVVQPARGTTLLQAYIAIDGFRA
jgi:hypothetical protein